MSNLLQVRAVDLLPEVAENGHPRYSDPFPDGDGLVGSEGRVHAVQQVEELPVVDPSHLHKSVGVLRCTEEVFSQDGCPQGGVLVDSVGPGNLFRRLTHHVDDEAEAQAVILDLPEDGGYGIRLVLRISLLNAVLPVYQIIPGIIAEGVNRFDLLVIEITGRPEDRIDELPPFLITSGWDVGFLP